jgi:hypothetical protein
MIRPNDLQRGVDLVNLAKTSFFLFTFSLVFSAFSAKADDMDDMAKTIAEKYDCFYGQGAQDDMAWTSVMKMPAGCTSSPLICIADLYCRKQKQVNGWAPETRITVSCKAVDNRCPAKAQDCIADATMTSVQKVGVFGGVYKDQSAPSKGEK